MPDEQTVGSGRAALAFSLESCRGSIIGAYEQRLREKRSPLVLDDRLGGLAVAHAGEVLDELVGALRDERLASPDDPRSLSRRIGESRASSGTHPVETIRAAADLFEIVTRAVAGCPDADKEAVAFAMLTFNNSMSLRIGEEIASSYGFLLDRLHHAQADERHRLARELHDRVGGEVAIASRQLELYETTSRGGGSGSADSRIAIAIRGLASAMMNIRQLTAGLRRGKPIECLEKGLRNFIDSAGPEGVGTELVVNGDEAWLAPTSRDEMFLAIREALRNAFQHARASRVIVRVDIAPHELHVTVEDDGIGFDPALLSPSRGHGLRSIAERMALLGGTTRLSSLPGRGAKIEIRVPELSARSA